MKYLNAMISAEALQNNEKPQFLKGAILVEPYTGTLTLLLTILFTALQSIGTTGYNEISSNGVKWGHSLPPT